MLEVVAGLARLVFVLAFVNLVIALLVNPWRENRPSDRFPAIVQDVTVVGLFFVIATVLMREQLLATSAVGAVVVGFALQDTLGNFFAGLAIQIEKPFRVGHWISIGGSEGQVQEVTWRATKLRTKNGPVPDRSQQRDFEGSHPQLLRADRTDTAGGGGGRELPVSAERGEAGDPPRDGQRAARAGGSRSRGRRPGLRRIVRRLCRQVLDRGLRARQPREGPGAHQHLVRVPPLEHRDSLADPGRVPRATNSLSAPTRTSTPRPRSYRPSTCSRRSSPEARRSLARAAGDHLFAAGETIVRQGDHGSSMFVILRGRVIVTIEPSGQQVATIERRWVLRRDVDADRRSRAPPLFERWTMRRCWRSRRPTCAGWRRRRQDCSSTSARLWRPDGSAWLRPKRPPPRPLRSTRTPAQTLLARIQAYLQLLESGDVVMWRSRRSPRSDINDSPDLTPPTAAHSCRPASRPR